MLVAEGDLCTYWGDRASRLGEGRGECVASWTIGTLRWIDGEDGVLYGTQLIADQPQVVRSVQL